LTTEPAPELLQVAPGGRLAAIVAEVAAGVGVPARPLEMQALLHLPRLADRDGLIPVEDCISEIHRVVDLVPASSEWVRKSPPDPAAARSFDLLDGELAKYILERFHYLRSFRTESVHYGLWIGGGELPYAIASTSINDVQALQAIVAGDDIEPGRSRVVSRVFAFPGAPRNAISGLLGYVARRERQSSAAALLTYVNPNLGFTGVSYRASGWSVVGTDVCRYHYFDGQYTTDRTLVRAYGTSDEEDLGRRFGGRFQRSRMALAPLVVYGRNLQRSKRR